MKRWILDTFFKEDLEAIKVQGSMDAFEKAHADIRETMVEDIEDRAKELARVMLDELLTPIDIRKIVSLDKRMGALYIGGERAEEGRLVGLKSEAEVIEKLELWHLLKETPKELAQREMFVSGNDIEAMKKGRSMLYTLDTQQRIIDTFKAYQQKKGT